LDFKKIIANYRLAQKLDFIQNISTHEIWFNQKIIETIFNFGQEEMYFNKGGSKIIIENFLSRMTKNVLKMNTLTSQIIGARSFAWNNLEYFN
jgi:hypothetical protein